MSQLVRARARALGDSTAADDAAREQMKRRAGGHEPLDVRGERAEMSPRDLEWEALEACPAQRK